MYTIEARKSDTVHQIAATTNTSMLRRTDSPCVCAREYMTVLQYRSSLRLVFCMLFGCTVLFVIVSQRNRIVSLVSGVTTASEVT